MEKIYNAKLRTNKNRIQQTDARNLKADMHDVLMAKIGELDVDITPVDNGFLIEFPNEELGSIVVEAKFVIKPLDYDVMAAGEQYQEKEQARLDKAKAKAAAAQDRAGE